MAKIGSKDVEEIVHHRAKFFWMKERLIDCNNKSDEEKDRCVITDVKWRHNLECAHFASSAHIDPVRDGRKKLKPSVI